MATICTVEMKLQSLVSRLLIILRSSFLQNIAPLDVLFRMDGVMLSSCIRKFVKIIHLCPPLFCFFQISSNPKFTHTSCGCVERRRVIQIIRLLLKLCCSLAGWRARNETKSIIFPARFSAVKRWIRQSSFIFKIRDVFEVIIRKVKGKKGEEIIH